MKILAIRGENLASLGRFELELCKEPLSRAGLFTITGHTGTGKSTILDALCVALFDQTPRLREKSRFTVGRPGEDEALRIGITDVRNLLRRGAGKGYAEVDFEGQGGRFRARWELRRARERPDGALQNQEMSLTDLRDGKVLARGRKTECLEAIEQRVGLSFDQFRRSALLAQGDFAAFLRASSDERSKLLAAMTGTRIYEEIGRLAFIRAREEEQRLDLAERELAAIGLMPSEARGQLEAEIQGLELQREELRAALTEVGAQLAWHQRAAELASLTAQAHRQLMEALDSRKRAETLQEELDLVERAARLRAEKQQEDQVLQRLEALRAQLRELEPRGPRLLAQAQEAEAAVQQGLDELRAAQERATAIQPELDRALALDQALSSAQGARDRARQALESAQAAGAQRLAEQRQVNAQMERLSAERQALVEGLRQESGLGELWQGWASWEERLGRRERALSALREAELAEGALQEAARAARGEQRLREEEEVPAAAALVRARQTLEVAEREARDDQPEALERARGHAQARLQTLQGMVPQAEELEDKDALAMRLDAQSREAERQRQQLQAEQQAVQARLPDLRQALERARLAHQQARAAQDLSQRRAELRAGEECPLCGSKEHPWAQGSPLSGLLHTLEQQEREAQAALQAVDRRLAALQAELEQLQLQSQRQAEELARVQARCDELIGLLNKAAARFRERPALQSAELKLRLEEARALLQEAEGALQQARERRAARDQAAAALGRAEAAQAQAQARSAQAAAAADRAEEALRLGAQRQAELREQRQQEEGSLTPLWSALPAWQAQGAAWIRREGQRRSAEWRQRLAREQELALALDQLRPELQRVSGEAISAQERERAAQAELTQQERELGERKAERGSALGGRGVEELRAELREGLARLDQQRQAREQRLSQLRLALAELEARLSAAREQQGELERAWAEARDALDEGLRREGLDRGQLHIWASRDDGWIQRVRTQLSELRDAVTRSQSLWELRRKEEQEHLASPMAGSGPEAEVRRQEVEAQQRLLLDQLASRRAARERDDQARARSQAMEQALHQARSEAEPWQVVGGLIGSADGKKFRTFSQSLTLEALLVQANHHLAELSPRYVLQRVPEQDLELQVVDRDMGEEVRSIHSLSGGETFLVSLSLALGLSSLSARNTRVETLFIDEGFGTLDGQTLEVVLHALDQLQHSGRQIGLISHVAGLAERIGVGVKVEPRGGGRSVVKVG